MNLTLQETVDAFERMSLDDRLHFIVRSNEELEVCVQFDRKDQLRCWTLYFRDAKDESSQRCSRVHFIEAARAFKLNESHLARELAEHLLTQAAFADQFVREVQETLGYEAVRESILQTQMFMDSLKDAVSSALDPRQAPAAAKPEVGEQRTDKSPVPAQPLRFRVIKGS